MIAAATEPTDSNFCTSNPDTRASHNHSQESGFGLGRKVSNFFSKIHMSFNSSDETSDDSSAWNNISSFFKDLYDRSVKLVNYVFRHFGEMLPPYFTKAGIGSVAGFIIGALTPIGPLWGTVSGLLIATGWQLGVECNNDRDKPDLARL